MGVKCTDSLFHGFKLKLESHFSAKENCSRVALTVTAYGLWLWVLRTDCGCDIFSPRFWALNVYPEQKRQHRGCCGCVPGVMWLCCVFFIWTEITLQLRVDAVDGCCRNCNICLFQVKLLVLLWCHEVNEVFSVFYSLYLSCSFHKLYGEMTWYYRVLCFSYKKDWMVKPGWLSGSLVRRPEQDCNGRVSDLTLTSIFTCILLTKFWFSLLYSWMI